MRGTTRSAQVDRVVRRKASPAPRHASAGLIRAADLAAIALGQRIREAGDLATYGDSETRKGVEAGAEGRAA